MHEIILNYNLAMNYCDFVKDTDKDMEYNFRAAYMHNQFGFIYSSRLR